MEAPAVKNIREFIKRYSAGLVLLALSILICLFTYKDRGVGLDEAPQREVGYVSYNYLVNNDPHLFTWAGKDHGVAFELPLIFIEKGLGLTSTHDIYTMRHIVTNIFFLLSAFFGYILIYKLFDKNTLIACTGFIMLAFMPRIYAHSFVNTKDIPFLAMFLITFAFLQRAFDKKTSLSFLLLGISCGLTTSIRIMGIIFVPIIFFCFLLELLFDKKSAKALVVSFVVFLASTVLTLYATWPALWKNPLHSFIEMYGTMSHYSLWSATVLFHGKYVSALQLPWNYIPRWFVITMPIVWLILGIVGIAWIIIEFALHPKEYFKNANKRSFLVYVGCFFLPIIAVIKLHSVLYDDWRHLYFVYPSFVLLALFAIYRLHNMRLQLLIWAALALQTIFIAFFMVRYHPFQIVYFNELVSHKENHLKENYEMDYWGVAYKQGLDYIAAHNPNNHIKVISDMPYILDFAADFRVTRANEKRIYAVNNDNDTQADYLITNFRWHPLGSQYDYPKYYEIKVLNSDIMCIYDLNAISQPDNIYRKIDYTYFDRKQVFNQPIKVVAIWSNYSVTARPVMLPKGNYIIDILSKGTPCLGTFPHNNLYVNNTRLASFTSGKHYAHSKFSLNVPSDTTISIKLDMDNDCSAGGEDRNTYVQCIYLLKN